MAGIAGDSIRVVLEPEAASLYCINQEICKTAKVDGSVHLEKLAEGSKYIVADLGGGTADLSVHEVLEDGNLREIISANGDASGGLLVDDAFLNFLYSVFGKDICEKMYEKHFSEMLRLELAFEGKKRSFNESDITLNFPKADFVNMMKTMSCEETYDETIQKAKQKHSNMLQINGNRMILNNKLVETFFTKPVDGIIEHIKELRKDDELGEINILLLVGGFSESKYLKKRIEEAICGVRIINPKDSSLAVLKGAVLIGQKPKSITERIARYTYGVSVGRNFRPGDDPEELKITERNRDICTNVFVKLIEKGQVLKFGDSFKTQSAHICDDIRKLFSVLAEELYISSEKDPKYAREEDGCTPVGIMILLPKDLIWELINFFETELVVGYSEFTLRCRCLNSGEAVEAKIDYLELTP